MDTITTRDGTTLFFKDWGTLEDRLNADLLDFCRAGVPTAVGLS